MENILSLIQNLFSKKVPFLVRLVLQKSFYKRMISFIYIENGEDEIIRPITAELDPKNLFLNDETFNEYMLVVPNIRDGDDFLITPEEYKQKLQNILIVMVNVHFKMYVFKFLMINIQFYEILGRLVIVIIATIK
jgi:hypothetical protein